GIDQARAHPFRRLAPAGDKIKEVLAVFGSPEDEGRGQEHRWLDRAFRQLRIVAIVQHQRFRMQHVVADVGLGRKRFHHGLSPCLSGPTEACSYSSDMISPWRYNARPGRSRLYRSRLGRSSPLARALSAAVS